MQGDGKSVASVDYDDVASVAAATKKLISSWRAAYRYMRKASKSRAALGPHATRARLTTASARYATAAEAFDREDARLREWASTVDPVDVDALKDQEEHAMIHGFRP